MSKRKLIRNWQQCIDCDTFDEWDIEHPPRRSKKVRSKMGMSGRSLKNLIGPLIDGRKDGKLYDGR